MMEPVAPTTTAAKLRVWLEAHHGEAVCDACVARPHGQHGCGRDLELPMVEAKRFDKPLYDLRHVAGLQILTERGVCPHHGRRSHYRLTGAGGATRTRLTLSDRERAAVRRAFNGRDAFTGASTERGHVDHRIPHIRTVGPEDPIDFDDADAIRRRFMWLSAEHNKLKNAQCQKCQRTGTRPAFLGISWWFKGDERYTAAVGCAGCGWAFPETWRALVKERLRE